MKICCYFLIFYTLSASLLHAENSSSSRSFHYFTLKGILEDRVSIINKIQEVSVSNLEVLKNQLFHQDRILWGDSKVKSRLDENTLVELILKEVADRYQEIGNNRSGALIEYNKKFDMGSSNHSGFSWSKPAGEYGFSFDRKLEPVDGNTKGDWIVKDSLSFYVEAATFIKKLQEQGSVEVSAETINALAGVMFKRTYQYHHNEKSFMEGLTSDFSKLFLGFLKFRKDEFLKLNSNDLITKEDQFLIKASGTAKIPLYSGVDLNSTFGYSQKTLSQTLIKCLEDQSLNIAGSRGVQMEGTINLEILGEFYRLIKIVFLAFEFDFSLKEQKRWHFYLNRDQVDQIQHDPTLLDELYKWTNLQSKNSDPEQSVLRPFIDVYEKRKEFNYNYDLKSILWRTSELHQDQYLEFLKSNESSTYYFLKSINQLSNYVENIWATIFPSAVTNLLSTFFGYIPPLEYVNSLNSKVEFEVKPSDDETEIDTSQVSVDLNNELFFEVERKMEVYSIRKSYFKKMYSFLTNYTALNRDKVLESFIKNRALSVPLIANSLIRVRNSGFLFFDQLTEPQIFSAITEICTRYNIFKRGTCENDFKQTYIDYKKERNGTSEIKLRNLNSLVDLINKYANSVAHYGQFFGEKNLFVSGSFRSETSEKFPFTSYFSNESEKFVGPVKDIIQDKFPYLNSLYEFDEAF